MKYDFLIVGAGLYGAIFAYEATKRGKKCLVIDKRNHIAGNIYTETVSEINIHKYGPHIFHTSNKTIWNYIQQFAEFNRFTYSPVANYKGELYNLPFNMNTFYKMWNVKTPAEAQSKIEEEVKKLNIAHPKNLEEQALILVGPDIYNILIKGYTEKQWGRKAADLPPFIIKRLPVRFNYDNNYFNDTYQGIPQGGYTKIISNLLNGIEIKLNYNYFTDRDKLSSMADMTVFTGMIDEFFDYRFGTLQYRSLEFETQLMPIKNFQGNAVINYTDEDTSFTRIIEHKHFEFNTVPHTIITYEYPIEWSKGKEPYYPVNDQLNSNIFKQYKSLANLEKRIIFGGRLADYKYYDMHHVIALALKKIREVFTESTDESLEII